MCNRKSAKTKKTKKMMKINDDFEETIAGNVVRIAELVRNGNTVTLRRNRDGIKITHHKEKTL